MDDQFSRSSLRDRILNDLRSTVKQIYHESVNNELSHENKSYLCLTLIKNLDEALRHGLKQLHLGYWRPVQKILHSQTLEAVEKLPEYDSSNVSCLTKGRTWIALSLRDDSFVSYIQCLSTEAKLDRFYEAWSILRNNDCCNRFLSILSGLDNVAFTFQIDYFDKPPSLCSFTAKKLCDEMDIKPKSLNLSKINTVESALTSPVDSGVHIQDSSSDTEHEKPTEIDILNGNVPDAVILRKNKKDTKRHVSFHEDIICKSPDKCRKLKWDSENLRYSWSGEEIDSSILCDSDFSEMKSQIVNSTPLKVMDINERGVPEGEETPIGAENLKKINKSHKSIIVKRFLASIKKQSKIKQLSKKYNCSNSLHPLFKGKVDLDLVKEINDEIKLECNSHVQEKSKYEIFLKPSRIRQMIKSEKIYKTYQLRDYLFIITNANVYLINKHFEMQKVDLDQLKIIVIYPDSQLFMLLESNKKLTTLVTGDKNLTDELLGRLELCMRRNHFDLPRFYFLQHSDLRFLRKKLVEKFAIGKTDYITYYGVIRFEKEKELDCSAPTWKRGFLMYKDVRTNGTWVPGDFLLKGGILYLYAEGHKLPKLAINLSTSCRSCSRTQNPDRPHTFQITLMEQEVDFQSESNCFYEDKMLKPKDLKSDTRRLFTEIRQKVNQLLTFGNGDDNSCVIEFAAADEYDMSDWLQMIIQASCGDCCEEATKDDVIDGTLLLTTDSLIILTETFSPHYDIEVLSCAQLCDIAAFKIGDSNKDLFTVIEFMCMEASSTSGDWILYMNNREELEQLRARLQRLWKFNAQFPLCHINEDRLISKCRKSQERLFSSNWNHLID